MTNGFEAAAVPPVDEMADILSRVRQVDPTSDAPAVRRYAREMADADAVLDTIDLDDASLVIAFSALWPEGSMR